MHFARAFVQVRVSGMSDAVGHVSFPPDQNQRSFEKPFSETLSAVRTD